MIKIKGCSLSKTFIEASVRKNLRKMTSCLIGKRSFIYESLILPSRFAKLSFFLTAKHFVEESDRIIFWMRCQKGDGVITVPISKTLTWEYIKDSDLAYCDLKELAETFEKITGKKPCATVVTEQHMASDKDIGNYVVLQDLIVVGYPLGKGSTWHKYPLFKKGYTSSYPKDALEDGAGYIDVCAIGGFSGAPIFIDGEELKFLGVLTSGLSEQDEKFTPISMYAPAVKLLELENRQGD